LAKPQRPTEIAKNQYRSNPQRPQLNTSQKINFPTGDRSNNPNSPSSLRIYADVIGGENNARGGGDIQNSNQTNFKVGVEATFRLGDSPQNTNDKNATKQQEMASLQTLTEQVGALCNPDNLQLSPQQCKDLKAKVSPAIMRSLDNVGK
jgi:hypothetical protein